MNEDRITRDVLISFAKGRLSREESLRILKRVEVDDDLSKELEEVLFMIRGIEDAVHSGERAKSAGSIVREHKLHYVLRIAAGLVIAFLTTTAIGELGKGQYYYLARIGETSLASRLRGSESSEFESAKGLFASGNRDAAIKRMERIANMHLEEESMPVVHLLLGEMLLCSAERNILGIVSWYDQGNVVRGMKHLEIALSSGDQRIAEEAHWLRLKGWLMQGDCIRANLEGQEILKFGKVRINDTRLVLQQIAAE
jgi:hypothetical protein